MENRLRVLIVEDSEDDTQLLLRELQRGGFDVEFERVETTNAMKSALTQRTWDLILSDYSLPNLSAPDALTVLKTSGLDLPFIIISGTVGEENAVTALKAGANDFLVKGKFARLTHAIERELREAESRRNRRQAEEQIKYHARLLRHINDAVIATDAHFIITAWNRAAERIYGWNSNEVIGRAIDELLGSGLSEEQRIAARALLKEKSSFRSEKIHSRKNGRLIYVEENTIALTDEYGKITGYVSVNRDITERQQIEAARLESEARYHRVLDAMMEGCQIIDFDWRYVYVNDVVVAQGKQTREEMLNHTMMEVYPGIENTELFAVLRECMEQRTTRRMENQFAFPDGSIGWFELSIQPAREGIFVLSTNITERKQVEEAHERLAAIVESSSDAIIGKTLDGIITSWNPSAEKIYGYTSGEVVGNPISILIPPDLSDELPKILKQVSMGESIKHLEAARLRKDGQRIIVSLTISPVRDAAGKIIGASTIARDITERKQAEEKIAYQSHLLENVNDAIVATDAQFNLTNWNHAAAKLYGYTADEVLGRKVQEILRSELNEEERAAAIQSLNQSGSYRMDVLQHHKDGHAFWVEGSTFAMKESDGHIYGYISINRDITERRRAEEAVHAKNEELKAMSQQLWQAAKLATMGELAASIAHELNNPLATVSLRAEMLQSQFSPEDPQAKSLQIIDSEVKRMSGLVMNLLQFSRRSTSQISTINVNEEVVNTLELVQYHLRKNNILTVQELSSEIPSVPADRQQLRQVFLNLFTNAADTMPLGGMLSVRTWSGEEPDEGITAPLQRLTTKSLGLPASEQPQVFIEVSDSGEGIAPEKLENVWEVFYTTKPEGKGTGLGLAICRRIIQEHGGTIEVFSEGIPGKGTTVRLSLPVVKER